MVRQLTRPVDYGKLYTSGSFYHEEREIPYSERVEHDVEVGLSRLTELHARQSIMDVGCANGGFLRAARRQGYDVNGIEPNEEMANRVTIEIPGAAIFSSWDEVYGKFDIITYHDVLEHIIDPEEELSTAWGHLHPRGRIIVDCPDVEDEGFAERREAWHHLRPDEHLWYFTGAHLEQLLERAGFEVLDIAYPIPGKVVVYGIKQAE
jgi:2-polyprenyl-3-methyl-5-hydroxy-6-metoxy-1,4-benzoquinol methylase